MLYVGAIIEDEEGWHEADKKEVDVLTVMKEKSFLVLYKSCY